MKKIGIKEKYIYWIFEYNIIIKTINSVWEILLGVFLFFDKGIIKTIFLLTENELLEDPRDLIAPFIQRFLSNLTHGTILFISIYLIVQGSIKIFLLFGLWKKKLHFYPISMYLFLITVYYQIYRFTHTHSLFLIFFAMFDLITIMLIQHEYNRIKKHLPSY